MVKISVTIPTINEENYIGKTLYSLKKQLQPGDEIIVVDSYSTDNTVKTAKKFGAKVYMTKRCGIGPAKNFAAKHAKNEIIAMLDADGIPNPDWLDRIREHFKDKNVNQVNGINYFESPNLPRKILYWFLTKIFFLMGVWIYKIKRIPFMPAPNCAIKKDVFLKYGEWHNVVCEDLDWGVRAKGLTGVIYDKKMIVTLSDRRYKKEGVWKTVMTWYRADIAILRNKDKIAATDYKVVR